MEGVATSKAAYVSWEEVNVSSNKRRREVHYYLNRRDGVSHLAVIGKEESLRHMSYQFAIKNRSLFFSSTSFYKLKSLREVVYWLNSVVSDPSSREPYCSVNDFWNGKDGKNMNFVALKIHDFVYVLAEEHKRLVAYLEDLYEDSRGNKMAVVRWFHKIATHRQLDPFVCCKQFENDDVKPFDVTQVKGYWKQGILRYMYSLTPSNNCVSCQQHADNQKTVWDVDDGVGIKPRKRYCQSKDDVYVHFGGTRESMDASIADVQDFQGSKNETESFNGGSSAFLSTDEAKKYSSWHLKVGSQVEILSRDSGMRGFWFRARIIKKHKDKVKMQYQDIQDAADEDNSVAVPDRLDIRICGRTTIQPSSQYPRVIASCIGVGCTVDVWWHDGWWEGIVIEKDSEDKFHVYFPGEKRESVFDSCDIRQSQEWLGNRWINIKERHDLVSSILRGRKQDAGKSYDFILDKNTISDGGQCGKDAADCNDSPPEPGNVREKDVGLVPDLSKDDLLSQLKWKSARKRKHGNATCVQKLNYSRNLIKNTAGSVTCERLLIPASIKVDNDNCKYMGDRRLTSLVMIR